MALKRFKLRKPAEKFAEKVHGELRFSDEYYVIYEKKNNLCPICNQREVNLAKYNMCNVCFKRMEYWKEHPKKEKKPKPVKVKVDRKSDQTKEIMRLLQDGVSQVEIARKYGISKQRVFSIKKNM